MFSCFRKLVLLLSVVFMGTALFRCANVMAPTGGPRDLTPPKIVQASPPNHSVKFTGNKFSITFDEFVKLDKINQQLLISPPMTKMPDFKLRKKTLTVRFNEPLKKNTTYSVFFGDAIEDVTEGNPLHNFTYVFSTGNSVDSMSLRGEVLDAENLKPEDGVYVMLYKNNNDTVPLDSMPLLVKPYYLSKTNKQGKFFFSGLADTAYLIFALKDENYSLTFDQPGEKIAFLDSLVRPQFRPVPKIDSVLLDTLTKNMRSDSAQMVADSLWKRADSLANEKLTDYQLYMFKEPQKIQHLMKASLVQPNTVQFVFSIPGKDITIRSLNYHPDKVWYRSEWSETRDTLLWFLRLPHPDTLDLVVMHDRDTLDSLALRVVPKQRFMGRGKKKKEEAKKKRVYLAWMANHTGNIKPGDKLVLTFAQPVEKIIPDSILLIQGKDSLYHAAFTFLDELHRKVYFPMKIKDDATYRLIVPDSSVIDWNGFFNKKIALLLHAKPLKDYSDLEMTLHPVTTGHYIFEILGQKEKPVATRYFSSATTLHFPRMNPGKYMFKVIYDSNGNKKWDPGDYGKKLLPERVIYYKGPVQLRANWEVDETWNF